MDLFCFASRNEDNIWKGVQYRKWAVATVGDSLMRGRISKAKKYFHPGCKGLLYCNPTQSLTTPFIVESHADQHKVVTDIWPEPWVLPFAIHPLGNPSRQLSMASAKTLLPVLHRKAHIKSISAALNITGTTVFVPNDISDEDWKIVLDCLAI